MTTAGQGDELAKLRQGLAERGFTVGRNPDGVDDTVAAVLLIVDDQAALAASPSSLTDDVVEGEQKKLNTTTSPPTDDEIERAAKAIYEASDFVGGERYEEFAGEWREAARAALIAARRTGGDDG